MELNILQENAMTYSFANYSWEEILSISSFIDEIFFSKLILHQIATISNLVHESWHTLKFRDGLNYESKGEQRREKELGHVLWLTTLQG
jgi:hypothetical protein